MRRLLVTTSREPSRRTRSFVKDLVPAIPHAVRVNRGKATYSELAVRATSLGAYGVLIVLERKGNPSALLYAEPEGLQLRKLFLLKISGVSLLREIPSSQHPYGLRELVLVPQTVPKGLPEVVSGYLVESLKPRLVEKPEGRCVELKVLGGGDSTLVSFICTTTDRECGPRFTVTKVVDYRSTTTQGTGLESRGAEG
jgi:U3 small nucleolar ribonucleoprotein protein IMP4